MPMMLHHGSMTDIAQKAARQEQLHQHRQQHAAARRIVAKAPAVLWILTQGRADEWGNAGAQINAHVVNGKGTVTPHISFGVELTHHGRDVGFEKSAAENQHQQTEVKQRQIFAKAKAKYKLTGRHDDATQDDGIALTKVTIRDPAAD